MTGERVLPIVLAFVLGTGVGASSFKRMTKTPNLVLTAPMLISTARGEPYYLLPGNTALNFEGAYAEGHQHYTLSLYTKGELPTRTVRVGEKVESTWLYPIDQGNVEKLMSQYPLSKDDLANMLRAKTVTREELLRIVRDDESAGVEEN